MGHLPKQTAIAHELLTPFHSDFSTESDTIRSLSKTFSLLSTEMLRLENSNQFGCARCCISRKLETNRN